MRRRLVIGEYERRSRDADDIEPRSLSRDVPKVDLGNLDRIPSERVGKELAGPREVAMFP
jgi:hypothetical protein